MHLGHDLKERFRQGRSGTLLRISLTSRYFLAVILWPLWPASAFGQVVEEEGTLEVRITDYFRSGASEINYFLRNDDGALKEIVLPTTSKLSPVLKSGQRVTVRAIKKSAAESGAEEGLEKLILDSAQDLAPHRQSAQTAAAVTGSRSALVIRTNFSNGTVPCSLPQIRDIMWSGTRNINGYYQENSYGALSFPADTDGNGQPDIVEVTINRSVTESCTQSNFNAWASAANQAAASMGVNLNLYRHRIYVLPSEIEDRCGWAGLAGFGCGASCNVWVSTCQLPDVYAHELGHNLGLEHAASESSANCPGGLAEYCDLSCVMGIGGVGWRHFNAPHKAQLGWSLGSGVVETASSGVYTLYAIEQNPISSNAAQTLRIPVPANPGLYYYISYRAALGSYSVNLSNPLRPSVANRTSIHYAEDDSTRTYFVTSIGNGQSFNSGDGIIVTQLSSTSSSAAVQVSNSSIATPVPTSTPTPAGTPAATSTPTPGATRTPVPTPPGSSGPPSGGPSGGAPPPLPTTVPPDSGPASLYRLDGEVKLRTKGKVSALVASALLKRFKVSVRNTASGLTYRTMGRKGYFHFPDLPAGTYHIKIKPSAALVRDPASFEVLRRLVKLPRAGAAEPAKFVFRLVKK